MLMILHKYVKTELTEIESFIINDALNAYEPVKDDELSANISKNLKEFFNSLDSVLSDARWVNKHKIQIKLRNDEPEVLIRALKSYKKTNDKIIKTSNEKEASRDRKVGFVYHVYYQDIDRLIVGLDEINIALKSSWVYDIGYE